MFGDYTSEVVGFSSVSHVKRNASDSGVQTTAKEANDQISQATHTENVSVQTESAPSGPVNYDEHALASFLSRVAPLVQEELDIEAVFSDLEKGSGDDESSLVRLSTHRALSQVSQKVGCMSWNSTGGTLAVGFSVVRHDTWCCHESEVLVHNTSLHRPAPPRTFHTSTCVTSLRFHPTEPSILMAGLYSGEVLVWDLRKEEDWVAVESPPEHSGQVVAVGWCSDGSPINGYTAGADGSILIRKMGYTSRTITTVVRFLIMQSHLNSKLLDRDEGLEITAVAQLGEENCVVGVGGGGLLHCSLSLLQPPSRRPGYKDPVIQAYQPHQAVVTAIRPGPGGKTFASVSSDGQIRVYKTLEAEPRCVVHVKGCPLDMFWTDSPAVFGVCGTDSNVTFLRATTGQELALTLQLSEGHVATAMEVVPHRGVVAVGDAAGNVEIWRVIISKR